MSASLPDAVSCSNSKGVYRAAEVWVNGRSMGTQLNGYLDFEYDVTDALHEGENLVAVRYDNRYKASSRWYTGEGINRNVWLHEVSDLRVDPLRNVRFHAPYPARQRPGGD